MPRFVDDPDCFRIACGKRVTGRVKRISIHLLHYGAGAGDGFKAAEFSAPVHRAVFLNHYVTDFTRAAAITLKQTSINKNSGADAVTGIYNDLDLSSSLCPPPYTYSPMAVA